MNAATIDLDRSDEKVQLFLPRVNGAGHSVVCAVVHGVGSPAVASHTVRAVVSGHSQVLREEMRKI